MPKEQLLDEADCDAAIEKEIAAYAELGRPIPQLTADDKIENLERLQAGRATPKPVAAKVSAESAMSYGATKAEAQTYAFLTQKRVAAEEAFERHNSHRHSLKQSLPTAPIIDLKDLSATNARLAVYVGELEAMNEKSNHVQTAIGASEYDLRQAKESATPKAKAAIEPKTGEESLTEKCVRINQAKKGNAAERAAKVASLMAQVRDGKLSLDSACEILNKKN